MPKVSFLIPAYNYQHYLEKCLQSVLQQSDPEWDLLIVNDCSSDGTWEICKHYVSQDSRIHAIDLKQNLGQYQIINTYSQQLTGEYCCVLDADDYLAQSYVEQMYNYALQYDFDIVMCLHQNIAEGKSLFRYNYGITIPRKGLENALLPSLLQLEYFIVDCGTLVKTSLRQKISSALPKVPLYAATDDMQALFLALHTKNIAVLKKPLYFHNQGSTGTWRNLNKEFRLKKLSSMLVSLSMVYHLANEQSCLQDTLPMAQNIEQKIIQGLQSIDNDTERANFYKELITFLQQQSLPFKISPQQIIKLENLVKEQQNNPNNYNKTHVSNWNTWNILKARIKQNLRTIKPYLPYILIKYIQRINK